MAHSVQIDYKDIYDVQLEFSIKLSTPKQLYLQVCSTGSYGI